MSKFLILDIGAGTMDILYYNTEFGLNYKAVVKSPVQYLAEKAASLPGNLLITGKEMGGGAISKVLSRRAQDAEVIIGRGGVERTPAMIRPRACTLAAS